MHDRLSIPFVTDVRATAFVARGREHGVNLSYYDEDGRPVASAFATLADVEAHARDLLELVATARDTNEHAPFGAAPRVRSHLMRDMVISPIQQATAIYEAPSLDMGGLSLARFTRVLTANTGAGA